MPRRKTTNKEMEELGPEIISRNLWPEHGAEVPISPRCFMCKEPFIPGDDVGIGVHSDGPYLEAFHASCLAKHNAREEEAFRKNPW